VGVIRETDRVCPFRRVWLRQGRTPASWRRSEIPDWTARLLLCAFLAIAHPVAAADKVDIIAFKNGDRLTCEIKGLDRGSLEISTDPLGTVRVHWGEVTDLESPRAFEVQVSSGYEYYGTLRRGVAGQVVVADGGNEVTLELVDIIRLTAIGSTVWNRIDGSVDAGFSFAQANLETHLTTNASATYRGRRYTHTATYGSNVTTREDADRTFRSNLNGTTARLLRDRWYLLGWSAFENNEELSLDLRLLGAGGFGRDVVHTNYRLWSVFSGIAYTYEQFSGEPTDESAEAALGTELDFFTPMNDDFSITNRLVSYFRLGGGGRVRLDLQSAYRHELFSDFYWSVNGFDTFDGDPPEGQKRNDFGISVTLGYKF
jgi:putative salt-induced outer membrane protein YdiY